MSVKNVDGGGLDVTVLQMTSSGLHIRGPQALSIDPSRSYEEMIHSSKLTLTSMSLGNISDPDFGSSIFPSAKGGVGVTRTVLAHALCSLNILCPNFSETAQAASRPLDTSDRMLRIHDFADADALQCTSHVADHAAGSPRPFRNQ